MLALALSAAPFAAARAAPPPPLPNDPARPLGPDVSVGTDELGEEIVIIARKLRMVNVHLTRIGRGRPALCAVLRSSGDAEVDALTCEAAVACSLSLPYRDTPPETMNQCARDEQARLIELLAQSRIEQELGK
ncbi:MAG: hypothetical protein ACRC1J_01565 [Sandaracinobacteroides sp.]